MDSNIIVAILSLIGTLGGSLGGILVSSKLTAYRLTQLEARIAASKKKHIMPTEVLVTLIRAGMPPS